MALKRVYLDQNHWITLARQHYGKSNDPEIAGVLALAQEAARSGQASFPISAAHYFETYKKGDPGSRQRLGAFMVELSRFQTIADATALLEAEVYSTLAELVQMPSPKHPRPFGRGVAHALNLPDSFSYFTDKETERLAIARFGSEGVFEFVERELLVGPSERLPSGGVQRPSDEFSLRQLEFERDTAKRLIDEGHSSDLAHRLVLAQETMDLAELLPEAARSLDVDLLSVLHDRDAWTAFMLSLPAKGAVCRMRMSGHENPNFRWHRGDLMDITALGTASGYCDVVVAEKHWGAILQRHQEHLNAKVTTSLLDLPTLLVA